MKQSHGIESKLIAGSRGIFEVRVNGRAVYAKSKTGRFPKPGEIGPLLI
ncbi:MAG: Rdx family protein [Verrucomicrobiae bacterium]|nr:Rdx family protein [Verrucomicrobiae bacterium]